MSSVNLGLVRSLYADWERGDFSRTDWVDPKIEWTIADGPSAGRWTGAAGMRESFLGMLGAWEDFRLKADLYRELDDERILVLVQVSGRGKTSGVDLSQMPAKGAHILHIRDDKVMRIDFYWNRRRVLADLGLEG